MYSLHLVKLSFKCFGPAFIGFSDKSILQNQFKGAGEEESSLPFPNEVAQKIPQNNTADRWVHFFF